jgi:hypothetical protein
MKKVFLIGAFLIGSIFVLSCGSSSSTDAPPASIDFSLPANVVNGSSVDVDSTTASISHIGTPGTTYGNALSEWAYRTDKIIGQVNKVLDKLNKTNVKGIGTFSVTTAKGTITGKISALSGDATYAYEAAICFDGTLFQYVKWSADGAKAYVYRDHSIEPILGTLEKGLKSELTYDASDSASTSLIVAAYGEPWNVPVDVAALGNGFLSEYASATKGSDNTFTLKGVRAWEASERTASNKTDPFAGDVYFTGKIDADTSGKFVVYRIYNTICTMTFNEANAATDPGWCFDGTFAAAGTTATFNHADPTEYWTTALLEPIGVAPSASMKVVEAPSGKTCL